jgi:hypothetical protein
MTKQIQAPLSKTGECATHGELSFSQCLGTNKHRKLFFLDHEQGVFGPLSTAEGCFGQGGCPETAEGMLSQIAVARTERLMSMTSDASVEHDEDVLLLSEMNNQER